MALKDHILSIQLQNPQDVLHDLCERFRSRRLANNLTQEGLAKRAGMSLSSLKRFERTGQIAFESLLNVALVLDCLDDFCSVCTLSIHNPNASLDQILSEKNLAKRGRIK